MTGNQAPSGGSTRLLLMLFALGLVLRLPGLLFNGMNDVFEMLLDWGTSVRAVGLAKTSFVNYGFLSYAAFGVNAWAAEAIPRFWWLPYKVTVIAFETGVLAALLRVADRHLAVFILAAYWLNPWFIWHGAYQGFWEGPYILFAVLAVLAVRARDADQQSWVIAGALLFISWQFKPQGLGHFAAPLGLWLLVMWVTGRGSLLLPYLIGLGGSAVGASVLLWLAGGSVLALVTNMRSVANVMSGLSNGGPGIWRFLSFLYMDSLGLPGRVQGLHLSPRRLAFFTSIAVAAVLFVLVAFARRLSASGRHPPRPIWQSAYLMMTMGALAMSQFGPRAHINHSYGAMVLLIPLLPANRVLKWAWVVGIAVLGLTHISTHAMGMTNLLPPDPVLGRYAYAGSLAAAVRREPAFASPDIWLRVQAAVNGWLAHLPGHQVLSVLSVVMFGAAIVMTVELFRLADGREIAGFRRQVGDAGRADNQALRLG